MKIVVVTARGLQAGALGAYGNPWIDTPALDTLAATSIVFDQHFADAADAAGARAAWRTGLYRLASRGRQPPEVQPPGADAPGSPADLLTRLRERQIFTFLIADQSRSAPPEFEAGWDQVAHAEAEDERSALAVALAIARATLDDLAGREHWLLWIDLATPLPPWDVPTEFQAPYFQEEAMEEAEGAEETADDKEAAPEETRAPLVPLPDPAPGTIDPADDTLFLRIQCSYAAAVSYLDAAVAELLDVLREAGVVEEALIIFTSDVGQALGEHGVIGTVRPWPHEEVIHLPLIVRLPKAAESGRRVAGFTQSVDLAPTLAEAFGLSLGDVHGHSLWPLLRGREDKVRDYAVAGCQVGNAVEYCLRTPEWAFLLPVRPHPETAARIPQLYVKPDDRWEVNDVRQHYQEIAEVLERTLCQFVRMVKRS